MDKIDEVYLQENCEVDIDTILALSVVKNLKTDESLKKDLRYLIGNESSKIQNMNNSIEQLDGVIFQLEKETMLDEKEW